MSSSWRVHLRADPVPWLLEPENPVARYLTLRDILKRPTGDPELLEAQAVIPSYAPVAELLARQKREGYWAKRDHYLPKHNGTFWVLCILSDLGLTAGHPQIHRSCDFMFSF